MQILCIFLSRLIPFARYLCWNIFSFPHLSRHSLQKLLMLETFLPVKWSAFVFAAVKELVINSVVCVKPCTPLLTLWCDEERKTSITQQTGKWQAMAFFLELLNCTWSYHTMLHAILCCSCYKNYFAFVLPSFWKQPNRNFPCLKFHWSSKRGLAIDWRRGTNCSLNQLFLVADISYLQLCFLSIILMVFLC